MDNEKNEEIVRAIVTIAHNLNMNVVAEGIETAEQLARLRALKCQSGQGYLFAGPMDGATARELIMTRPQW
jgi:EAL domain-containing protein (putative c-di-GMP-specific phosphodiesterase class I)